MSGTETPAEKKAREEAEAAERKAQAEATKAAEELRKISEKQGVDKAREEAERQRIVDEEAARKEEEAAREKEEKQDAKAPSLLDQILNQNAPAETFVPTYDQNRWKVGPGHSLLGPWVEGQEVDVNALMALGKTDQARRANLERLLNLGAIVRMGDHEPQGGIATGHLAPLNSQVGATNPDRRAQVLMGPDMRERIDGQATAEESRRVGVSR